MERRLWGQREYARDTEAKTSLIISYQDIAPTINKNPSNPTRTPKPHPSSSCRPLVRNACTASMPIVPLFYTVYTPTSKRSFSLSLPSCGTPVSFDHHILIVCGHIFVFLGRIMRLFRLCIVWLCVGCASCSLCLCNRYGGFLER